MARADGEGYALTVAEPHRAIPALLDDLDRQGRPLARLTTRHVSLEDVFVSLTGRHLRDDDRGRDPWAEPGEAGGDSAAAGLIVRPPTLRTRSTGERPSSIPFTLSRTSDAPQLAFLPALSCSPPRVLASARADLLGLRVPDGPGGRARLRVPEPPAGADPGRSGRGALLRADRAGHQEP